MTFGQGVLQYFAALQHRIDPNIDSEFPMYIRPELQVAFDQAVALAAGLALPPNSPANHELYALYHQATLGDIVGARPGHGDFAARARWDAWHHLQGTPIPLAMRDYVELVESLLPAGTAPLGASGTEGIKAPAGGRVRP